MRRGAESSSALLLSALVLLGCAGPLRVSDGRMLPASLAFDPAKLEVADSPPRPLPAAEQLTLRNGLRVSLVEARGAGLVDLALVVRCGRVDDAVGLPGISELLLGLALNAGAGELDARTQHRRLGALGVAPAFSTDDGESWVTYSVRSEDLPGLLALLGDALGRPRFDEAVVRARLETLARGVDLLPAREAGRAFVARQRAAYPGAPPLVQAPSRESWAKVERAHFVERATRCFGAENLALALSGDVGRAGLDELLAPLAALPRGALVKHPPVPQNRAARALSLVPTAADQVEVSIVGPGLPRGGHRAAAEVLSSLLESSLFYELRGVGKIYSLSVGVDVGPDEGATWLRFSTRREEAFEATRRALAHLQAWWSRWPLTREFVTEVLRTSRPDRATPERRALRHARARLQDDQRFDPLQWDEGATTVKEADVRAFFVRAFRPEFLQVVVTGPLDPKQPWSQVFPE